MRAYVYSTALLLLSLFLYSFHTDDKMSGKELYDKYCVKCHGEDGTREKHKAKNLKYSRIADTSIASMVRNGKKTMPSYRKKLTEAEIRAIVRHTKTLRK